MRTPSVGEIILIGLGVLFIFAKILHVRQPESKRLSRASLWLGFAHAIFSILETIWKW